MKRLSKEQLNYLNEEKKGNSTIDESIIIPSMETSNSLLNLPSVCQGRVKRDGTLEWEKGHLFSVHENKRRKEMIQLLLLLSNIPYQNLSDGKIIVVNVHKSTNFLSNVKIILAYMSIDSYYYSHSNSNEYVPGHVIDKDIDNNPIIIPELKFGLITITKTFPSKRIKLKKRLNELGGTNDIGISHKDDYIPSFFIRFSYSGWQSLI